MKAKVYVLFAVICILFSLAGIGAYQFNCSVLANAEDGRMSEKVIFMVANTFPKHTDFYSLTDVERIFDGEEYDYYSAIPVYDKDTYCLKDVVNAMNASKLYINAEADFSMQDYTVPSEKTDPYLADQWYLEAINAKKAWEFVGGEPGKGVVVAVVDSGIYYKHNDLKYNILNYSPFNDMSSVLDEDGHGSHVAGIIGMYANNYLGGAGVAYSAKLLPVKVGSKSGTFLVSDVIKGIKHAINNGADIINMSFGAENESAVLYNTLSEASKTCVLIAAAGNESNHTNDTGGSKVANIYPAAYPFVIGVMASDENGNIASFSNYDTKPHTEYEYELAAPGTNIFSTHLSGYYRKMSGTSMAAPIVSGAAAILYQYAGQMGIEDKVSYVYGQLKNATSKTASYTDSNGGKYTYKALDIYEALTTEPGVNIGVNRFRYVDGNNGTYFEDSINISESGETNIFCGFNIYNVWSAISDVSIDMKVNSPNATVISEPTDIQNIESGHILSIECNTFEAMVFSFKGEKGRSYNIPITYTVTAKSGEKIINQTFNDNITINVGKVSDATNGGNDEEKDDSTIVDNGPVANTDLYPAIKKVSGLKASRTINKSKKFGKIHTSLKWKKNEDAVKYEVYYSTKRNGGYKKLVTTGKNRYAHKRKVKITNIKKRLFYKVRAVYSVNEYNCYGDFSKIIKM